MKKREPLDICYAVLDFFRLLLIVFVAVLLLAAFVVRKKEISGSSMYPTLKDKEHVLINVAASYLEDIERFDIVVARSPDQKDLWIKRVIGLPGERIAYQDGALYVNGSRIEETFLDAEYVERAVKERKLDVFTQDMEEIALGEDDYFLAGDNRITSLDSRSAQIGAFHREDIIAKGVFVYAPFDEMRYIKNGS